MPLYVVQMYYATLKESSRRVSETMNVVAALSRGDCILIRRGEQSSAIAFASDETELHLEAKLRRLRDPDFSLLAFDAAWVLGGRMSKRLDDWLDRHDSSASARPAIAGSTAD